MAGSFAADCSVAYAKDIGDPSKYCPVDLVKSLDYIHYETEFYSQLFSNDVIGVIYPDGSKWGTEQTKYYVSEEIYDAFWDKLNYYMFPARSDAVAKEHYWVYEGLFDETDPDGNPNWTVIDGKRYLTSISVDEIREACDNMWDVMAPLRELGISRSDTSNGEERAGAGGDAHVHNYVETTVQEATATTDKIMTWECSICGQEQSHIIIPGTAVDQFVKDTITKLEKAPVNGSITVDTDLWTCFDRAVIEALKNRQDVTVTVNFSYQGVAYTFTIPAGYGAENLDALLDENGYCGFMYLLQVFGGQEIAK